jgi:hypothetical protein
MVRGVGTETSPIRTDLNIPSQCLTLNETISGAQYTCSVSKYIKFNFHFVLNFLGVFK